MNAEGERQLRRRLIGRQPATPVIDEPMGSPRLVPDIRCLDQFTTK